MDVEGPGDGADGFTVADEFSGEFLLVGQHFLWPAEGHAARLGGQPAFLRAAEDEGALELGGMRCTAYGRLCGARGYAEWCCRIAGLSWSPAAKCSA